MKRPGYYVEGRWFRDNIHQARARAAFLAQQYGRPVPVMQHFFDKPIVQVLEVYNGKQGRIE